MSELDQLRDRCRKAWRDFARGNPGPAKEIFSHADDVTLANPFGPAVRGWEKVSETLDYASSRFSGGKEVQVENIEQYVSRDLASFLDIERWEAKVGGRGDVSPFVLRVSTTYRREGNDWKIVHRHADPISTFNPDGPLRSVG